MADNKNVEMQENRLADEDLDTVSGGMVNEVIPPSSKLPLDSYMPQSVSLIAKAGTAPEQSNRSHQNLL